MIYIDEVKEVQEKYNGKPTHFRICLYSDHGIHLKAPDEATATKWVQTIREIKQIYDSKNLVDIDKKRKWKEKIDITVVQTIMEEVESRLLFIAEGHWDSIKHDFDYTKELVSKDLMSSYSDLSVKMQKSRFMMSYLFYCEIKPDPKEEKSKNVALAAVDMVKGLTKTATNMLTLGVNFMIPLNIFWDKVFCIMATSKSYVGML